MSLIFGYDHFLPSGEPITNAFEADIKNNKSPINLGWAGYKTPQVDMKDSEIPHHKEKFPLHFPTYYDSFRWWFDIKVKEVKYINEKYYYIIDLFVSDFWQTKEALYPKISSKTIQDIKNGNAKILLLFCNEALNSYDKDIIKVLNFWVDNYDLPFNSIVLSSGNFSFEKYVKRYKGITYISFSIWEYNTKSRCTPERINVFTNAIIHRRKRLKTFLCYNRRVRSKRLDLVYALKQADLFKDGLISLGDKYDPNLYKHIPKEFLDTLPLKFDDTDLDTNQAGSFVLRDFLNSYISIVSETWLDPNMIFPTEKIVKPIIALHPFLVLASPGFLNQLEKLGYKTFSQWFDQSYDKEQDENLRIEKIVKEVKRLCSLSDDQLQNMLIEMLPILKHNVDNFVERTTNRLFQKQLEEELWK